MHLHLLSLDESYVNCIEKGPHVPMKVCTGIRADGEQLLDKMIPNLLVSIPLKTLRKCTEIKTMNILSNGLNQEMFDNVISCSSSKQVWDTIKTKFVK